LKKLIIAAVAVVAVAVLGIGSLTAPTSQANPAKIWVINGNVSASIATTAVTPAAFDTAITTDNTTRAIYLTQLDTFQTASAGQVAQTAAIAAFSGTTYIVVQTDGSGSTVTLNGRGLDCTPACDGTTTAVPDAVDHIVTYTVDDAGTHNLGDTLVATATQDAVTLDSNTMTVVGQAHDLQLASLKATIQEGLTAADCTTTSDITNPARAGVVTTYTDINGTALVGYFTSWASSSASNMVVATPTTPSMLLSDGKTIAAGNVICGVTAGSANLTSKNTTGNAISGITGQVTRTQAITITGVPAAIALTADPATIACDGSATSTVTAKVTDSAGNNVVDNTPVTFSVVALGTANPIQAKTTGGSASSTITPLSGSVAGTTVIVTAGSVQSSIRVDCLQPTPTTPPAPAGTPTATGGGTIVGPNTGTGGYLGQDSTGSFPMWTLIALAMGSVALVAGGMVTRRAGK
jgi:hypothetical protein